MNWDALGAIGEIVGAAGVIASLLYLAIQIKSAEKSARLEARRNYLEKWRERNFENVQDPERGLLIKRIGTSLSDEHDEVELEIWRASITTWFISMQGDFELHKDRVLSDDDFNYMVVERLKRQISQQPRTPLSWERSRHMFRTDFRNFIDSEIKKISVGT